ncbi:hypothetical protein CLV57_3250 [Mucilaginibacter auburnensis]|uniref:Acyltransferase-like protein n=2 Tax=Mucilaginibacter auburnensis TaxID=1457233 RepID=A0A2H9VP54_9SPHI|nr:hypothetical protein CLV57_3250 [Mucilaginibacter auburnensis]
MLYMIIKSKPLKPFFFNCGQFLIGALLKRRFNKLVIRPVDIKPGHSYILMCNHFSFLDGFLAFYLCGKVLWKPGLMRRLYIMSVKKQMEKNPWLRYCGSFSVEPGKFSMLESFDFIGEKLSEPGNLFLYFPQGNLESMHIPDIEFQDGINEVVQRVKGKCQLLWCSTVVEYFESSKPSVYFDMLDCGTVEEYNFKQLVEKVNTHHKQALQSQIRFTCKRAVTSNA